MSNSEFEMLVVSYLDGTATKDQVIRLRNAIKSSEDMQRRFHARVRLYQAQVAFLSQRQEKSPSWVMACLSRFAQRFGRPLAHLCLLALVFVELRVSIPAEYSGWLFYVEDIVEEQETNFEDMPVKFMISEVVNSELDLPTNDMPDAMGMPNVVMPEVVSPVDETLVNEA
jgi:hypothetical protein